MFDQPKYIQNNLNVIFPRQLTIRREANQFEDILHGKYVQPQIIPIPDELDPEVPRIVFGSTHGYSHILISQVSASLMVSYSPDWQINILKGQDYLLERISILFDLMKVIKVKPYFCGLTTLVRLPTTQDNETILNQLSQLYLREKPSSNLYDLEIRRTEVDSAQFFRNVTIQNYRDKSNETPQTIVRNSQIVPPVEVGIQIITDYNDRYAFNEIENYQSSEDMAKTIIEQNFKAVLEIINQVCQE